MQVPVRGVGLVDVLVGTMIVVIVFLGFAALIQTSLTVAAVAKARANATSIANNQMEYIRSLSYDVVGTVGGIPAGVVPQYATTTINSISFITRTYIEYADDAADGTGAADTNGIITDYKHVKIEVYFTVKGRSRTVTISSKVVPPGLESATGGGILKINVVDASGTALSGASVRIVNASTTPTVDFTTTSDVTGAVYVPGAATSTQYQIYVSRSGYSSAQTYARDATNQNPTPGYLTIVENQTTTSTFAIDQLATMTVRTYEPVKTATSTDTFISASSVTSLINAAVAGGALTLSGAPGTYPATGSAAATSTTPSQLRSWKSASASLQVPAGTTAIVRVIDGSGTPLPDSALPGNSTGFTSFPISLSAVATTTYPSLALAASFTSSDPNAAPAVLDWNIAYEIGPTPLPNVSFTLTGAKTIGTTGAGASIFKTTVATTTDASGVRTMPLEWDVYALSLSGYDTVEACAPAPYTLAPGSTNAFDLYLDTNTTNAALISVRDASGAVVSGASVTLSRTGYTKTVTTTSCGTAYFGSLTSASNYTIEISKTGYTTTTYTGVSVAGHLFYAASFD